MSLTTETIEVTKHKTEKQARLLYWHPRGSSTVILSANEDDK